MPAFSIKQGLTRYPIKSLYTISYRWALLLTDKSD